ncbi:hypothetical protein ACOJBM_29355 [Rhizobium beringeri]
MGRNDACGAQTMAEMTPEQQRALVIAAARLRLQRQPQQTQSLPADDAISVSRTGIGGLIEGIPIAGPIIRDWTERAAGGTLAAFSDETYDQVMDRIHDANRAEKEANPIVDKGAQITGAVAGTIPAVMAAPAAFGAGGGSLLLRSGISGLTGATIGGADAGVRSGGDAEKIKEGITLGGLFGLGGPVAGKVIGAGARSLVDALRTRAAARVAGMDPQAFGYFRRAVTDDGLDAMSLPQKMQEMGSNAIPADLGPNLQKQAGALAATPGAAQTTIRTTLADRGRGRQRPNWSNDRRNDWSKRRPVGGQADIAANQNAHSPLYREAFREARPYSTEPIASALEADISRLRGPAQARLRQVRGMLNIADSMFCLPIPASCFRPARRSTAF